jgi:hypothetical protein
MRTFFLNYRSLPLLLCLVCIILTSTLRVGSHFLAYLISGAIWSLLIAASASLLNPSRLWFRVFFILALLILANVGAQYVIRGEIALSISLHLTITVIHLLTLGLLLRHAFGHRNAIALDRISGAVAGYLLLALIWGNIYNMILVQQPYAIVETADTEPVKNEHIIYYSLVTLTTQGYGDIVPKSSPARIAAALEGTVGTLYLAALIAFLIGMIKPEE